MRNKDIISAYFSMEFAFDDRLRNFAGGLGVLAADIILSAADLGLNMAGMSLIYHFEDEQSRVFLPKEMMKPCQPIVSVRIEGREVKLRIWRLDIKGRNGHVIPVFFLSSYLPENKPWDRDLTRYLYSSDSYVRLGQETILGVGGMRALKALGYRAKNIHMNEGHAALAAIENYNELKGDIETTRNGHTFTTHTPLESGHDYFEYDLVKKTLGDFIPEDIKKLSVPWSLGMTQLAYNLSKKSNAVSVRHKDVCEVMFPGVEFLAITNGVHHGRWAGKHMAKLYDRKLKEWRRHPEILKQALDKLSLDEAKEAKAKEKSDLVDWINAQDKVFPLFKAGKEDHFDKDTLTIGFARRLVPYKRANLIFRDIERLRELGNKKIQLVFAGNRYKNDSFSNGVIESIDRIADDLRGQVKIALFERYNLDIAKRLVTGCDAWLNNPIPGSEASGTSGMKAALNGGLNISIMDGWWIEAFRSDNKCGWSFGEYTDSENRDESDFNQLLDALRDAIDCYYRRPEEWTERGLRAIALIGYFNTERALKDYLQKMWT